MIYPDLIKATVFFYSEGNQVVLYLLFSLRQRGAFGGLPHARGHTDGGGDSGQYGYDQLDDVFYSFLFHNGSFFQLISLISLIKLLKSPVSAT